MSFRRRAASDERGFTLVELLVVIAMLSVALVAFYQVLFNGLRSSDTSAVLVDVSEEARAGFNRMVRDVREAERLLAADEDGDSITVEIDFDGDGVPDETETFAYDSDEHLITLNGEVLMEDVYQDGTAGVFDFTSNLLEYDTDGDGVAHWSEIDASDIGDDGDDLDDGTGGQPNELFYITNVVFRIDVRSADGEIERTADFLAEAQMRNSRGIVE